ncbi:MAG: hypothetical protein Q9222_003900 [Ikaeria aurantiellina]
MRTYAPSSAPSDKVAILSMTESSATRGALIVIEGLDRAGKSTQCGKLFQYLQAQGRPVKHLRFPDRSTTIGKSIDSYLKGNTQQEDHVIHLLFSANRWEAAARIISDIANGVTIIVDRYYYSGAVYSTAKNNPNLSFDWAMQSDIGLPKPDICFFLDISLDDASGRGGFGNERYETNEMQRRVRDLFQTLIASPGNKEMTSLDAGRPVEAVHKDMIRLTSEIFQDGRLSKPLAIFDQQ